MMNAPLTTRLNTAYEFQHEVDQIPQVCIMVIDDSMTVRAVIEASLRRHGFDVSSFPDGLAAMGALARGEVPVPDLLLLDIGLPKMDGYEVARILRSKADFNHTIIVMLTAHDGMIDRFRSKMVGASAFITKPFRVSYVIETVRQQLKALIRP